MVGSIVGGAYVWICYLESGWTARWALLGQSLRRLGRSGRRPGRSWGGLGGLLEPWRPLGRSWAGLGGIWGALGLVLGAFWALLGRFWRPLGRSWSALGAVLDASWALLGASWRPKGSRNGGQEGPKWSRRGDANRKCDFFKTYCFSTENQ